MTCLICRQAKVIGGLTSVKFERGEMHLMVNYVPALVCHSCGEAYTSEEVAKWLLQSVEEMYRSGMLEEVIDYKRLCVK
jgi:YgiT-type zinc finger domain-containing protein